MQSPIGLQGDAQKAAMASRDLPPAMQCTGAGLRDGDELHPHALTDETNQNEPSLLYADWIGHISHVHMAWAYTCRSARLRPQYTQAVHLLYSHDMNCACPF